METFLHLLREALNGHGELVLGTPREGLPDPLPAGVRIVVTTSGSSTGKGRPVGLTPGAIISSAAATHERLGGPGQWLLTLPHEHIAGLQVCARSLLAGHPPVVRGDEPLHEAISRMSPGARRYTSLVPTQLTRILAAGGRDLHALGELDAVLLGGAAVDPSLLEVARQAGLRIVTTYGSTETSGGCVYDGVPLTGVNVRIDAEGRINLSGPMLAWGYLDGEGGGFVEEGGTRWFTTNDLGELTTDPPPALRVLGRADDVIITGGVNVHPLAVENVIRGVTGVGDCTVVGLPSPEWGTEVVAVVVAAGPGSAGSASLLREVRARVQASLGGACAPRALVLTANLPTRGPGKVDRRATADLAAKALAAGDGARHRATTGGRAGRGKLAESSM